MDRDEDLAPNLLSFLEEFRKKSNASVSVEDGSVIIGMVPNCAIVTSDQNLDKIVISFHFDCHPLSVVNLTNISNEIVGKGHVAFSNCFLSDTNGVLVYETDTGFSLMNIQYLRDVLASLEKRSTAFLS